MGVVNVTPDSFSDGGAFLDRDAAVKHGLRLAFEGAHLLDVGGESTRPGAEPVPERDELDRVIPVIEGIRAGNAEVRISIDTSKAAVAAAALDAGAAYVNDVTALRGDPEMAALVAERGVDVCLMHMLGTPRTMQSEARYGDVVAEVKAFLAARIEAAVAAGIGLERIEVDPGIGFAKTIEHNLELLARLRELTALGRPLVLGTSRKSFLGTITGRATASRWRLLRWPADGPRRRRRGLRRRRAERGRGVRWPRGRRQYRDRRPVALHPPRSDRGRARDRPAAGARRALRRRRARCARDRPRRGHRRLRRGLPGDRADRAGALVQDARAAVRRDRRPARLAVRRRQRHGQGVEARAADPAAGRGGLGRGLARGAIGPLDAEVSHY